MNIRWAWPAWKEGERRDAGARMNDIVLHCGIDEESMWNNNLKSEAKIFE